MVGRKPDGEADERDDDDDEDVADQVGRRAPGEHGRPRDMGRARNRSMRPFCRSSARPMLVLTAPKATVCTKMPGIR